MKDPAVQITLALTAVVAWAAIDAFGVLHGCGIVAALWLVMPQRT